MEIKYANGVTVNIADEKVVRITEILKDIPQEELDELGGLLRDAVASMLESKGYF